MKQVTGHLIVVSGLTANTSDLGKGSDAYKVRYMVSSLLGLSEVPEKWVKVRASDKYNANNSLWETWNENNRAINLLLYEHGEIMKQMEKLKFSPESDEMDKLISRMEETTRNLENRFEKQNSLREKLAEKGNSESIENNHDWYQDGYFIDGEPAKMPFPEELPALLFEDKKDNETITFAYGDTEFSLIVNGIPDYDDESQRSEQLTNDNIQEEKSLPKIVNKKPSMPLPAKITLGVLGGLALAGILAACIAGARRA